MRNLIYARLGHGYVIDGIENEIPAEARAISGVKLLGTTDPDRQNDMIELARQASTNDTRAGTIFSETGVLLPS